ncbi:TetR family transcriptional regulator [Actinoplanes sp. NPDC051343]|jgi:AcrR family transcriptional regulator|uniref:TetR family transcriptional regulator n=1 Tax=Actinoplanes sp. NPDC051343 TaxID=3363906 RepID=UPI0037934F80
MTSSPPAGLRERKKAKTRAAIREAAMTLFEQQGYGATTVEQIAEAAEVSPSTFFRYFPTKEAVVITDDWDPLIADVIRSQPPEVSAVDALMAGIRAVILTATPEDMAAERRRQRLFQDVPELRSRYMQQMTDAIDMFAGVLAERAGRATPDLAQRAVAGALIGVAMAVLQAESGFIEVADYERYEEALRLVSRELGAR